MRKARKPVLTLNRETLRHLDAGFPRAARGGEIPDGTQATTCRGAVSIGSACSGIQTVCHSDTLPSEKNPTCQ